MKDAKDLETKPTATNGKGPDPLEAATQAIIAKIQSPVDPYLALGVETARRMQLQNALDAAMSALQMARDRIAVLEKEAEEHHQQVAPERK